MALLRFICLSLLRLLGLKLIVGRPSTLGVHLRCCHSKVGLRDLRGLWIAVGEGDNHWPRSVFPAVVPS